MSFIHCFILLRWGWNLCCSVWKLSCHLWQLEQYYLYPALWVCVGKKWDIQYLMNRWYYSIVLDLALFFNLKYRIYLNSTLLLQKLYCAIVFFFLLSQGYLHIYTDFVPFYRLSGVTAWQTGQEVNPWHFSHKLKKLLVFLKLCMLLYLIFFHIL